LTTGPPWIARAVIAALALACALPAHGQVLEKLTVERIHAEPALDAALPTDLAWSPDGRRVTWLKPGSRGGPADLWALEANSGKEALLVVGSRVQVAGSGSVLPLRGYAWLPSGDALLVAHGGDLFVVDVAPASARTLVGTPEHEEFTALSPDGQKVAFVRKNDLYVVDVASGRETRLTRSGSDTVLNGRLDWVYEEELGARSGQAFAWSPDSRKIAYLQLDQAQVPTFPIVDFIPAQNTVSLQRYPRPGDTTQMPKYQQSIIA
jgi:dipeptidyl-peptidase-4